MSGLLTVTGGRLLDDPEDKELTEQVAFDIDSSPFWPAKTIPSCTECDRVWFEAVAVTVGRVVTHLEPADPLPAALIATTLIWYLTFGARPDTVVPVTADTMVDETPLVGEQYDVDTLYA